MSSRTNPPPQKIPPKILLDPLTAPFFRQLRDSLYQLWYRITECGFSFRPPKRITADYDEVINDDVIIADATAASLTVTLLPTLNASGRVRMVKKIDSTANTVTIDGDGINIDGSATRIISTQYDNIWIVDEDDGTNIARHII